MNNEDLDSKILVGRIEKAVRDYYSQPQFEDKRQNTFYSFYDSKIKEINVDIENKIVTIILHCKSKRGSQMARMVGKKGKAILSLIAFIQEKYGEEWKVDLKDEDWRKSEFWRDRI